MGQLALPLMAVGTLVTAYSQIKQGSDQKKIADLQGEMMDRQANESQASAQRDAAEVLRQGDIALSRSKAVAAASGAGADDATVQDVENRIAARSEYNAMAKLYSGATEADTLRTQGQATRAMGKQARAQGILKAVGTIADGGGSLYDRFK